MGELLVSQVAVVRVFQARSEGPSVPSPQFQAVTVPICTNIRALTLVRLSTIVYAFNALSSAEQNLIFRGRLASRA